MAKIGRGSGPSPLQFSDIISPVDQALCALARADLQASRRWYNRFFFLYIQRLIRWLDEEV